jgi:raffinose/stachyose/melibiose transport system substrate-binding protein
MMNKRSILRVVAVGAAAAFAFGALTACSSGGGSSTPDKKVTLTFWQNSTTGPGVAFWKTTVANFEKANKNITINMQSIQNEDLDGKLQTALNSGSAPDIFLQRGGGKMAAMVKAGQLMDLTGLITAKTKAAVGAGAFAADQYNGKSYAMPVDVLPEGIYYSKDMFKAAGITDTPTTFNELNSDISKLKSSGVEAVAVGAKDAWPAAHWYYNFALRECSESVLNEAAKTLKFTDGCWLKAGKDVDAFNKTNPFNNGFLTTAAQQGAGSSAGLVANHKAAMELMGAWDPGVIASLTPDQKPLPDLGWFPFPSVSGGKGDPAAMMGGVDGYSCSAQAPKDACAAFMNYIVTTPVQEAYYKAFDAPPVNTAAQGVVTEDILKSVLAAYKKAPYVSQYLDTNYGQNVGNALNSGVVNILAGKGTPADVLTDVSSAAAKG